ncbi:MAG: AAA family ATPase, partial [Desulfobacterales bacterium]|nr:AAA family ATPase [Desulfobacterales bacterium]
MKKLPIGTQDFEVLQKSGSFYLDKTKHLFEILSSSDRYYFFSRPRRFGKSLMLSVIKNIFLGKQELFNNLFIDKNWVFEKFPVIYLSFSGYSYERSLEEYIKNYGQVYYKEKIIKIKEFKYFDLGLIIEEVSNTIGKPVVCLIDEYDKPILVHLKNTLQAEKMREFFSAFYAPIKDRDSHIRFFFLTGLTKLMKMSIFSVLNNLKDIGFKSKHEDLIGYTQTEVEDNFREELAYIAQKLRIDYVELILKIKKNYNGYNFGGNHLLYNPWDINNFIDNESFGYYWADTGIPSAISDYIEDRVSEVKKIIDSERSGTLGISEMDLRVHNLKELKPVILFFYSGYLTIKETIDEQTYSLKFPNFETEQVMSHYFLNLSLSRHFEVLAWKKAANDITEGIFTQNAVKIKAAIETIIYEISTHIPYDWLNKNPEGWLKTLVGIAIRMNQTYYAAESQNIIGRTDMHLTKEDSIYVLELKVDDRAENAIKQIETTYEPSYRSLFKT